MAFVSKKKAELEMARVEYIKGILPPNDVAKKYGLNERSFRNYLVAKNDIKPEHRNKKARLVENALQAIDKVQNAEVIIPAETRAIFDKFADGCQKFKCKGLDDAYDYLNDLKTASQSIDKSDPKQIPYLTEITRAFKNLCDSLGVYPKAPTIAIQNNLQQNLQTQTQGKEKKLRLIFDEKPKNERD